MDPEDPDVKIAVFGKEVEEFLQSDIGDYLLKQAKFKEEQAINKLKLTLPWRWRKIQQLQNEIRIADDFQNWLAEAVFAGQQAMKNLEEK